MIRRIFRFFFAALFPWLVLLLADNPGGALIALIMQASVIGWIPASVWAWRTLKESNQKREDEKRKIREAKRAAKIAKEIEEDETSS